MDLKLSGKRALITGGATGIGYAIAATLANEGCAIWLAGRRRNKLQEAASKLQRIGAKVAWTAADLSNNTDRERLVDEVGELDILVNNAGSVPAGSLSTVDEGTWRAGWESKVFGYIALCRRIYPLMAARRRGVIINVIGVAGEHPDPAYIAGSSGNAALMAFTQALGREAPRFGVRVVGVNPGFTLTARGRRLLQEKAERHLGDRKRYRELLKVLPFGRAARPRDIGDAVAFLASARAAYISAHIVTIDGGQGATAWR